MRRYILWGMTLVLCLSLTGCGENLDKDEILTRFDALTEHLASSQFTEEKDLIGERAWTDENRYQGSYSAHCQAETGRDVIFGGASIQERKIKLKASAEAESGTATLRVRLGTAVEEHALEGELDLELDFSGGGNYVMVDYEDFTGTVTLEATDEME